MRVCAVCGERIERLENLTQFSVDVYVEGKEVYNLHSSCMSEVTIEGL